MNVTEFENTSSVNLTINVTLGTCNTTELVYDLPYESVIMYASIAVLTLFLNSCMIACLQKNKLKIPEVIYKQLISLCLSDLIAGISPALFCLTWIESVNHSSKACAFIMILFPGSQNAVLFNMCSLSFRRWIVLRKADVPSVRSEPKLIWTIMFTLLPWIVIFVISSTFVGMTETAKINGCMSLDLKPIGLFIVAAPIITLLSMNIFYISSVIMLKRLTRKASAAKQNRQSVHGRAFFHLFAVLIVTNITTIPAILLPFVMDPRKVPIMKFIPHFQAMNSVLNPILYSAHINEIRASIKDSLFPCL